MADDVARRLREAIHEGRLKPGQRVGQEAIAEDFGVGRMPVREALRRLEAEGLVVIRAHSGARVATLDFGECEEIYKMRERLEPLALAESIERITPEQIKTAEGLAAELTKIRNDPAAFIDCDRRLHIACYAGVATPRLLRTIEGFWNTTQQYRRVLLTLFTPEDYAAQDAEHFLIVDSLKTRNVRFGEDIIRAHIERSRLRLAANRELFDGSAEE
jgi:DNA-binding GntR family transcriptional regulator